MYRSVYAYPRDLADEGLDAALGRIRESGLNTITLAATDHVGRFAGPPGQSAEVTVPQDGAVCFRARPERYGHIKPRVDPTALEFDALAELQRAAPDLGRAAWVACGHHASLGAERPEYVMHNAFGDAYPHSLCPAHPAVRDYVVNLCSELAHGYDLAAVVLETPGWLSCDRGYHRDLATAPPAPWATALLSLCFADATRRAARVEGIDADRLQVQVRELLERYSAGDLAVPAGMAAAWWLADLVSEPQWTAFLDWRARQVAELVSDVKAALPAGTALAVIPSMPRSSAASRLEGIDIGMLAAAADVLEIPAYQASAEAVYLDACDLRRRTGDNAALDFILRPDHLDLGGGAETDGVVRKLEQAGLAGLAIYHYGDIRRASPAQIKAALAVLDGP